MGLEELTKCGGYVWHRRGISLTQSITNWDLSIPCNERIDNRACSPDTWPAVIVDATADIWVFM